MKTNDWTKRIQERVKWKQLRSPRLSVSEVVAPEEEVTVYFNFYACRPQTRPQ
jgi:hypothetical protein